MAACRLRVCIKFKEGLPCKTAKEQFPNSKGTVNRHTVRHTAEQHIGTRPGRSSTHGRKVEAHRWPNFLFLHGPV